MDENYPGQKLSVPLKTRKFRGTDVFVHGMMKAAWLFPRQDLTFLVNSNPANKGS